jgi:hypothetical protein
MTSLRNIQVFSTLFRVEYAYSQWISSVNWTPRYAASGGKRGPWPAPLRVSRAAEVVVPQRAAEIKPGSVKFYLGWPRLANPDRAPGSPIPAEPPR